MRFTHHRVHKLNAVILGRVVARGDHDTNGLAVELPRAEGSQQANTVYDGIQQVAAAAGKLVSFYSMLAVQRLANNDGEQGASIDVRFHAELQASLAPGWTNRRGRTRSAGLVSETYTGGAILEHLARLGVLCGSFQDFLVHGGGGAGNEGRETERRERGEKGENWSEGGGGERAAGKEVGGVAGGAVRNGVFSQQLHPRSTQTAPVRRSGGRSARAPLSRLSGRAETAVSDQNSSSFGLPQRGKNQRPGHVGRRRADAKAPRPTSSSPPPPPAPQP